MWGILAQGADEILKIVSDYGVVGVMALLVVMFIRDDLVSGKRYRREIAEKDVQIERWVKRSMRGTRIAEEAIDETEHVDLTLVRRVARDAVRAAIEEMESR